MIRPPIRQILLGLLVCTAMVAMIDNSASGRLPGGGARRASLPRSGLAGDFYVSVTGSDRNDGSKGRPWATITHASGVIFPGATVHVAPGSYAGPVETSASGRVDARIHYVSDHKGRASIVITRRTSFAWINTGSYVDIDGFEITGNAANGLYSLVPYVTIKNNHVHHVAASCDGNGGSGINVARDGHDNIVTDNVVHHVRAQGCNTPHGVGIYIQTPSTVVYNNLVYLNGRQGIQMWHGATHDTIVNNTVFGNGKEGILVGCGDSGCGAPGPSQNDDTIVANNISVYNECGIREYGETGTHNQYRNNLLYGNQRDLMLQNGNRAKSTVSADPAAVFIDWRADGTGDYRLRQGSPAHLRGTWDGVTAAGLGPPNPAAPPNIGAKLETAH